jgi:hypothetical protein
MYEFYDMTAAIGAAAMALSLPAPALAHSDSAANEDATLAHAPGFRAGARHARRDLPGDGDQRRP